MATIKIHNWKVTDEDDTNALVFVPPEYHPTYWEIPKWWYKGDRTVYTSCVRVDIDDATSLYIDGTSPLMQIQIDWDGSAISFSNWRDIRRVLVIAKGNLGPVNRGSEDYTDFDFTDYKYDVRVGNYLPVPPLVRITNTQYDNSNTYASGSELIYTTATFEGGAPPVTYRHRIQQRASADDGWVNSPWINYDNTVQQVSFTITGEPGWQIRAQGQARDKSDPVVQVNANASLTTIT